MKPFGDPTWNPTKYRKSSLGKYSPLARGWTLVDKLLRKPEYRTPSLRTQSICCVGQVWSKEVPQADNRGPFMSCSLFLYSVNIIPTFSSLQGGNVGRAIDTVRWFEDRRVRRPGINESSRAHRAVPKPDEVRRRHSSRFSDGGRTPVFTDWRPDGNNRSVTPNLLNRIFCTFTMKTQKKNPDIYWFMKRCWC
jgi:hypothetical protein